MKKFKVTIKGVSPLLQCNHLTPEQEGKLVQKKNKGGKMVKNLDEPTQMLLHAYKNKQGKYYQPSTMVEAALSNAGSQFKMRGNTRYTNAIKAGVFVEEQELIHKNQKFEMFGTWGVNHNARNAAVWVVRPKINDWEIDFTLNLLLDEQIENEALLEILKYAGLYVGIGAWRPKYGRFEVVKFEEIKTKK